MPGPENAAARRPLAVARPRARLLYTGLAAAAGALVFAGFAPTFYLRRSFGAPALEPIFLVHGVVFSSWFVLLTAQAWLVATRRVRLHRQLGVAGAVVAVLMVVLGPMVAIQAARSRISLAFLVTPLTDIAVFALLVGAALGYRQRPEMHRRLMLVASIAILPPAIARLPFGDASGPLLVFGLTDLFLLGVVAHDVARSRRLHPVFLWGGLLLLASQPLRIALSGTRGWLAVARWLVDA